MILEPLETRWLLTHVYEMYGLNFGPYIGPGENPDLGPGQISEVVMQQRLATVTPVTTWTRTFGATGDLEPASGLIREQGNQAAIGAWIGRDATSNQAEIDAVDVLLVNYYPFWEGISLDFAVAAVHSWHHTVKAAAGNKEVIVSETGWPSAGESLGDAHPSLENAAAYALNFVSWARANDVAYFYFAAYDESWKTGEGKRGKHWGIFYADQTLKPGMELIFLGETVPDNWTSPAGPPIIVPGENVLRVSVESDGVEIRAKTTVVTLQPTLRTHRERLLYVDVVQGDAASPVVTGTVVVDLNANTILGLIPEKHVRGISPDGAEIYMHDRTVISTSTHQQLRTLPFSSNIPSNAFLVSPSGDRLYSEAQVVDVASNVRLPNLPVSIVTGNSWSGAPIPGGPAITPDESAIFTGTQHIDLVSGTATTTSFPTLHLSDVAVSPDGQFLLIARYGQVLVYDLSTLDAYYWALSGIGDFSGEIAFLTDTLGIVGSSGNPQNRGGGIHLSDLESRLLLHRVAFDLADNLTLSPEHREVFVTSGTRSIGREFGVDVWLVNDSNRFEHSKTFYLGMNRFEPSYGRPRFDQVRKLVHKPQPGSIDIHSTEGNDTFELRQIDQEIVVTRNGEEVYRDRVTQVYEVRLHPGGGSENVIRFYDTPGQDVFYGDGAANTGRWVLSSGVEALATGFQGLYAYASDSDDPDNLDKALLYGSAGDDRFYGQPAFSYLEDVAGTYFHHVEGFGVVEADAGCAPCGDGGGDDQAWLYDGPGDDTFYGRVDVGELISTDTRVMARGFDQGWAIALEGNGENDTAYLYAGAPWQILGEWENDALERDPDGGQSSADRHGRRQDEGLRRA